MQKPQRYCPTLSKNIERFEICPGRTARKRPGGRDFSSFATDPFAVSYLPKNKLFDLGHCVENKYLQGVVLGEEAIESNVSVEFERPERLRSVIAECHASTDTLIGAVYQKDISVLFAHDTDVAQSYPVDISGHEKAALEVHRRDRLSRC